MTYIATFFSHYGAICFKRELERMNILAKLMPVPRSLSSSCGTCTLIETDSLNLDVLPKRDLEGLYILVNGEYEVVSV